MRINLGIEKMANNYNLNVSNFTKSIHGQSIASIQKKDTVIEGIQKQITNIHKQMLSLSENDKLSAEDKMERQKELQKQVEDLNKMMLERNMEIKKEEQEEKSKAISEKVEIQLPRDENNSGVDFDHMQNFISMGNSLNAVKAQNSIRTKLKGEARILESEIKLDQARGVDTTKKSEKLSALSTKIDEITSKISENLGKVDEEIKKGVIPADKNENTAPEVKDDVGKEDRCVENKTRRFIDVHI